MLMVCKHLWSAEIGARQWEGSTRGGIDREGRSSSWPRPVTDVATLLSRPAPTHRETAPDPRVATSPWRNGSSQMRRMLEVCTLDDAGSAGLDPDLPSVHMCGHGGSNPWTQGL